VSRLLRASGLAPGGTAIADRVWPNAGNTGANLTGIPLLSVPSQATSGPGWTWNSAGPYVHVGVANSVISGLSIPAGGVYIQAAGVTFENCFVGGAYSGLGIYNQSASSNTLISNCIVQTPGGGNAAIEFEGPASYYATIQNCTISGINLAAGRITSGVAHNGADPLFTMTGCNVFWMKNAFENAQNPLTVINVNISGNYMHDLGYVALDHSDTLYLSYGIGGIISGNTLYNQLTQTNAFVATAMNPVSLVCTGNLMAGGGFALNTGTPTGHISYSGPIQNFTFTNNWFSTVFFPNSGLYGPAENWGHNTNTWAGNYWLDGPLAGTLLAEPSGDYTFQTAPAVPASGVPLVNPFGIPITVVVTAPAGCTLTAVTPAPNTALIPPAGATSAILVPGASMTATASITLTYSGTAPTWTWTS
jgi:hypothetical protein